MKSMEKDIMKKGINRNDNVKVHYQYLQKAINQLENTLSGIKNHDRNYRENINHYSYSDVREHSLMICERLKEHLKLHYRENYTGTYFELVKEDLKEIMATINNYADEGKKSIVKSIFRDIQKTSHSIVKARDSVMRDHRIDHSINRLENHVFGGKKLMADTMERMDEAAGFNTATTGTGSSSFSKQSEEYERERLRRERRKLYKKQVADKKLLQKVFKINLDRRDRNLSQLDIKLSENLEFYLTGWQADELPFYKNFLIENNQSHLIKLVDPDSSKVSIDYEGSNIKSMLEAKTQATSDKQKDIMIRKYAQL